MKNYYEILEVNKKASIEIVDKTYSVLLKKYDPNKYTGEEREEAEKKIKDLNEAHHVLADYFLREQYDLELEKEEQKKSNKFNSEKNNTKTRKSKITSKIKKDDNIDNEKNIDDTMEDKHKEQIKRVKRGSIMALIEIIRELFHDKTSREQLKKISQIDLKALAITIVIMIVLLTAMWFIPFTNGFVRELTVDNPLISWMFK